MAKMQVSLSTGDAYADGIVARTLREVATAWHAGELDADGLDGTQRRQKIVERLMLHADRVEGSPASALAPVHQRMTDREAAVIGAARSLARHLDSIVFTTTGIPSLNGSLAVLRDAVRRLDGTDLLPGERERFDEYLSALGDPSSVRRADSSQLTVFGVKIDDLHEILTAASFVVLADHGTAERTRYIDHLRRALGRSGWSGVR